jgi:hypothetical protein
MADVKFEHKTQGQMMRERLAKKVIARPGIRVSLAPHRDNPTMRRLLRHPKGGGFGTRATVEWPNDVFTFRRLRDGDIVKAEQQQAAQTPKTKPSTRAKSAS